MEQIEDDFHWSVDSDSSNECEPWEEYGMLREMLDTERMNVAAAATPQWRQEQFYQAQFPLVLIEKLFANDTDRASNEVLESRNFVFVTPKKGTGELITTQYRSFRTPLEMQNAFQQDPPLRIEVGSRGFEPACLLPLMIKKLAERGDHLPHYLHTKELVFDVDITGWDEVRDCNCIRRYELTAVCNQCGRAKDLESDLVVSLGFCECEVSQVETKLCSRCWCYVRGSMMVMNYILTQQYGFRQMLFVFSGSKGYHCWVFDQEVKTMTQEERELIAEHFNPWVNAENRIVLKDEGSGRDNVLFDKDNAFMDALFIETVVNNGVFTLGSGKINKLLIKLLDMDGQSREAKINFMELIDMALINRWNPVACWTNLKMYIQTNLPSYRASTYVRRILYMFIFPRIDVPVTTQIRHLIKLPYSLHQTTKLISTPILAFDLLTFDPSHCANVTTNNEIEKSMRETEEEIDIMFNPLNTTYYCQHCHPKMDAKRLSELFIELAPKRFAARFLISCLKHMSKFRMFRTLEHLQHHIATRHGEHLVMYMDVDDTLSEWLRYMSTSNNYCNTRQYEVLSLCFLFLMLEKHFVTTLSPSLMRKMSGLNLIPSDQQTPVEQTPTLDEQN